VLWRSAFQIGLIKVARMQLLRARVAQPFLGVLMFPWVEIEAAFSQAHRMSFLYLKLSSR
jgi:hypothetical protein